MAQAVRSVAKFFLLDEIRAVDGRRDDRRGQPASAGGSGLLVFQHLAYAAVGGVRRNIQVANIINHPAGAFAHH